VCVCARGGEGGRGVCLLDSTEHQKEVNVG